MAGSIFVPVAVGSDALVGGSGSDILFGDSIRTDGSDGGWAKLVADNPGLSNAQLHPGCQQSLLVRARRFTREATTALIAAQAMTFCTVRR